VRKLTLLIAAASLLAVSAACSSSSSSNKTVTANPSAASSGSKTPAASNSPAASKTPTAATSANDESDFAKSMLLTAADFPAGYIETPSTRDPEQNPLQVACGEAAEAGKTGRADSSDFQADANAASVSETIIVFGKDADAQKGIDAIQALIDCAVKAINAGKLNSNGVEFSGATSKQITLNAPSDKSYAFEVQTTGSVPGQTGDLSVTFTLIYARKGRIGYQLTVTGGGQQLTTPEIETYAKAAAAKIKQRP
jgi:hypothetical protein